jgi:leucyl aminopeptidase
VEFKILSDDIAQIEADAIVVGLLEGEKEFQESIASVDRGLNGAISSLIDHNGFKSKFKELSVLYTLGNLPSRMVTVVGLGKREELTKDRVRGAVGEATRSLRRLNCRSIAVSLHTFGTESIELAALAEAVVEGSLLGLYTFSEYKESEYGEVERMIVVAGAKKELSSVERGVHLGQVMAEATIMARNMVNEPGNVMTPGRMAEMAGEVSRKYGLGLVVLDRQEMDLLGMNLILGVASGSREPPKMVVLDYHGDASSQDSLGFVGKGITFDSGGISIKPAEGMEEMKDDMSGGAVAMAALSAIARLKLRINVTAVIPSTENLPGGSAMKPGDVIKAMNGKTVEVVNTDAEGRLVLADALNYVVKERKISALVDIATLTGACRVALGTGYSGIFGNNQQLIGKVINAGAEEGELFWPMPLPEDYRQQIKSEIADIKNTGEKYGGGAITAALFLSGFVGEVPWVHLDIAGTAFGNKDNGYLTKGATGVGVRTLIKFALMQAQAEKV